MRTIDADALENILSNAIEMMRIMAKTLDSEDDPEIQMEIKAYTDILNGVKELPTINPERKTGKWNWIGFNIECSECGAMPNFDSTEPLYNFCPNCGADMRGVEQ